MMTFSPCDLMLTRVPIISIQDPNTCDEEIHVSKEQHRILQLSISQKELIHFWFRNEGNLPYFQRDSQYYSGTCTLTISLNCWDRATATHFCCKILTQLWVGENNILIKMENATRKQYISKENGSRERLGGSRRRRDRHPGQGNRTQKEEKLFSRSWEWRPDSLAPQEPCSAPTAQRAERQTYTH